MTPSTEQVNAFKALIQSQAFSHASKYRDLLSYLFEAYTKGKFPKETDIAVQVFRREDTFNPAEDTIVRVSMHKLRKKLEAYYQNEGKCEPVRLKIPKGHYNIHFQSAKESEIKNQIKAREGFHVILGVGVISLLLIGILLTAYLKTRSKLNRITPIRAENPVWKDFLQADTPVLLAMGTLFFFENQHPELSRPVMIRDLQINSLSQFNQILDDMNLNEASYDAINTNPYFDRSNVWPILSVLPLLHNHEIHIMLRQSRFINPEEIHQNNIIFLGNIKTHGVFKHFMDQTSFQFGINPPFVTYMTDQGDTIAVYPDMTPAAFHEDYGMVAKVPGPSDNYILIFTDFDASANSGAARFFTSKKSLNQLIELFEKKYGSMPQYFEVLFRTKGLNRTEINTEIVHYKKLELNLFHIR